MIYTVTLNPARDRTVVIPGFRVEHVNRIQSFRDDPGGKGINVSKMIRALGGESVAMGILGGATGRYIRQSLSDAGISGNFVFTKKETRTNIKVVDPENHSTTDINEAGAPVSARVLKNVYSRLREIAKAGDIVVFAGKIPEGASADMIAGWIWGLAEAGVRVFLDADRKMLAEGVKAAPYLIKPNQAELSQLLGRELVSLSDIFQGARQVIRENGVHIVAVSMGAEGALFVTEDNAYRAEGLKVPVLSTVGAGDAMTAALAFGEDSGLPIQESIALSMAASAACVSESGTQAAPKEKVEKLLKETKVYLYTTEEM